MMNLSSATNINNEEIGNCLGHILNNVNIELYLNIKIQLVIFIIILSTM